MSLIRFMPPRGTSTQCNAYVGTLGELFVDTTAWQLRMSDGVTAGGHVQGGISNLIGCSDVDLVSVGLASGQYLRYDAGTSKWHNVDITFADISGALPAANFPALTGDVTTVAGALAATIAAGAVSLAKMANLPASTIMGNNTVSSATPLALTAAQVRTLLALATSATTDTTNASNITSGTLPGAQLSTLSGDVTNSAGAVTISAGAVTLAKMANLAANSFIGNNTGSAATPVALSPSLAKTLLAIGTADVAGLASFQATAAQHLPVNDSGTFSFGGYTSTGNRTAAPAPNAFSQGITWEFKNAAVGNGTGNYTGILTLAPWTGTTASTGDPNYQLSFNPTAANSTSAPVVLVRAGIDTTWGSWATMLHSANYSSYALPLTGGTLSGPLEVDGGASTALLLTQSSSGPWSLNLRRTDLGSGSDCLVFNAGGFLTTNCGLELTGGLIALGNITLYDAAGSGNSFDAGFRDAPLRQINASTTLSASDRGKSIELTGGSGQTLTFPTGFSQSGGMIMVVNLSGNSWTLASAGTLTWLPTANTGTRTLANNSVATAWQIGNAWYVFGFGIT